MRHWLQWKMEADRSIIPINEPCGIPTDLALECISIHERIVNETVDPQKYLNL
jgi:hypothetical protein